MWLDLYGCQTVQKKTFKIVKMHFGGIVQRVLALLRFWDLRKICVSGTVGGPSKAKIPHLHVHKPKIVVLYRVSGGPPVPNFDYPS